jgi:putative sterol carrier protein
MSVENVFKEIDERLKSDPAKSKEIDGSFRFNVTENGAGTWIVDTRAAEVRNAEEEADVTITVTGDDLIAIQGGTLNAMQAFMMGKVQVDGDMGLAMRLQEILS